MFILAQRKSLTYNILIPVGVKFSLHVDEAQYQSQQGHGRSGQAMSGNCLTVKLDSVINLS